MFEPDEEQKAVTIDKKEQQKIDDDFEKCDKQIDAFINKQLPMYYSAEYIKENALDKGTSTQIKTDAYLSAVGAKERATQTQEAIKAFITKKGGSAANFGDEESCANLVKLCLSFRDATLANGHFNRMNEPLLIIPQTNIQKFMDYETFKYSNKRDPNLQEMQQAAQNYHPT